jgi:hypothetical protein
MSTAAPEQRSYFTVRLRALPGVDGVRALRKLLKFGLRACGLRAVSIAEESVTQSEDDGFPNSPTGRK